MANTNKLKINWQSFILLSVIFVAVAVGVIYVGRSQDIRNKAAISGSTLSMKPNTISASSGKTFPVGIILNSGQDNVVASELQIIYDPQYIKITGFTPGKPLPIILTPLKITPGAASITLGANPNAYFKGTDIVGTITAISLTNKPATISFSNNTRIATIEKPSNTLSSSTGISINRAPACIPIPPCKQNPDSSSVTACRIPGTPPNGGTWCPEPIPPQDCYYQEVQCIKAPCDRILVCPNPPPVSDKPYCSTSDTGSNTNGWYMNGKLIRLANCGSCQARCSAIGSRSEGWYDCNNELITWANCGNVTPPPTTQFCTQVSGTCIDKKGKCNSYNNGCKQAEICATPIKVCSPAACTMPPACAYNPTTGCDYIAQDGAPYCPVQCWNRVSEQQEGYYWPNGCKGNPNSQACTEALVNLTSEEMRQYKIWISQGKPVLPTCIKQTQTRIENAKIDKIDYVMWVTNYNQAISGGDAVGDFNNNGKVDGIDYVMWLNNYRK